MKKLAILHTTPVTIPSMKELVKERTDQVEVINLLDDSMLPEINRAGKMTEEVRERIGLMVRLAEKAGADAFLSACSSIGGAVEEQTAHTLLPVYRIDMPMARQAAVHEKIGVAATLRSTIEPTCELIERLARQAGRSPQMESVVIEGAGELLNEGKTEEYDRVVRAALEKLAERNDIVVLAQASMARAVAGLPEEERTRYLTSPVSGVEAVLSEVCRKCGWKKKEAALEE